MGTKKGKSKWSHLFRENPIQKHEGPVAYHQRLIPELEKIGFSIKYRTFADAYSRFRKRNAGITSNKKEEEFHWKDWIEPSIKLQELYGKSNAAQDFACWSIETDKPICVVGIGDTQIGSWGTNMESFLKITHEILTTPNLYVILLGYLDYSLYK